jgi:hypothetical protein
MTKARIPANAVAFYLKKEAAAIEAARALIAKHMEPN